MTTQQIETLSKQHLMAKRDLLNDELVRMEKEKIDILSELTTIESLLKVKLKVHNCESS